MNVFSSDDRWQKRMRDTVLVPHFYREYTIDESLCLIDEEGRPSEPHNANCKAGSLRRAVQDDLPELMRLFSARACSSCTLDQIDRSRVTAAFHAGMAKNGMLLVAPGARGRIKGFLIFGNVDQWWSGFSRLSELCLCVDRGHLRSKGVRELGQFSAWARKNAAATKPSASSDNAAAVPANAAAENKIVTSQHQRRQLLHQVLRLVANNSRTVPAPSNTMGRA